MEHKIGFLKVCFAAAALTLCAVPAAADVVLSVESVTASPGSTGNTFDVLLTNSGSPTFSLASFNFEIQTSDPDITFTGIFVSTATAPYIFSGSSLLGPEIDTQTSPTAIGLDLSSGSTTVNSGDVFGLGQVFFNVSPTATTGPFSVSFTGGTAGNNLSDPTGANIPITTLNGGTINVSAVPEPSAFFLMLTGTATLAAFLRRRRA